MSKSNGNGNAAVVDAITAERMRLAGLAVPGEVSAEHAAWEREVLMENNAREVAGQMLVTRDISVDKAFALASEYVHKAFDRMNEIQRRKPTGAGSVVTQ